MKRFTVGLFALVALLRWAAPALAQGPWGMGGGPRGHHMMMGDGFGMLLPPFILGKLNLSDDQRTKVQGIMADYHATVQPLFQQLKIIHEGTADKFYASGDLSPDDFTAQTQQAAPLQEQIKNAGLTAALKTRAVLTPDQLAQAAQIIAQIRAARAQMHSIFAQQ